MYRYRKYYIPEKLYKEIQDYIYKGIDPKNNFLVAVICNNLESACMLANAENLENIIAFIGYFRNEAPSQCWGTPEKMEKWIKNKKNG